MYRCDDGLDAPSHVVSIYLSVVLFLQRMVETSMLAAVAGLSYMFASLFKLEGYLSYVLPLPVVLSSVRSGPLYSLHCVFVVFLLLFSTYFLKNIMYHNDDHHHTVYAYAVLMGPVRGVTYMLVYGFLSVALGITFRLNVPWIVSVPLSAVVRLLGQWLYIMVTSWVTRENLIELLVTNAQTLLVCVCILFYSHKIYVCVCIN